MMKLPPHTIHNEGISILSGDNRGSKAKSYAAEESKNITAQYIDTIDNLNVSHDETVGDLQAQLDAALLQLKLDKKSHTGIANDESKPKADIYIILHLIDLISGDEVNSSSPSNSMSGLSESVPSINNNKPIIKCIQGT